MLRAVTLLAGVWAGAALYDPLQSDVGVLTATNWMNQVVKGQQNDNVWLIHFFDAPDARSVAFAPDFAAKAKDYKGVFQFGYVDCSKSQNVCKKEGVGALPVLRLYPPVPFPAESMELDVKAGLSRGAKFLRSFIVEVTDDSVNGFVNTEVTLPKVLFFTDKDETPLFVRALSRAFNKKLSFGIVRKTAEEVRRLYKVSKFPELMVLKSSQKKPDFFSKTSGELNYKSAFEFLNSFSEQFVPTIAEQAADAKPWLFESVPELSQKSANDLCLGLEKVLCVILFSPQKPEKAEIDILKALRAEFDNKVDRAAAYKFMWIDASKNTKWVQEMKVAEPSVQTVRVLNPGRRKRFATLEGPFSLEAVQRLLEKISGGDARFTPLAEELPSFSTEL